ncbi:MAG: helix-turn-helix domain-containing protein [Aquirhabdus sp.]
MELKPENKPNEIVPANQADAPVVDPSGDVTPTDQSTEIKPIASESKVDINHDIDSDSIRDSSQNISPNTDPSVSSGSPMSTSSLPLSTQTSSTQTPGNAQRPGERLRQARLLKNRDIKDIAAELNISERLLTAIEADDYKSLPEPAFIRGYLRGYGRLLGIDADALIAQFNEIYTSATGLSSNHSLENSPLQQLAKLQTRSRKSNRWMWWLLIPLALIVLFLVLRPIVKKVMGPSATENTAAQTVVLNENPQYGATTMGTGLPPVSSSPLAPLPQVNSSPLAPLSPVATTQSTTDQLVLTLSKASDVTVQDSTGKTLVSGTQGTEKPLNLTGSSPFSITLGDAASVNLSLNNEHIDLKPYTVDGHASFRLSR